MTLAKIALRRDDSDVLIIGGGIAGLLAAIRAREFVEKVTLVEKAKASKSGCSPFAAGIFNARFPTDDEDSWLKEVVQAGDYLNDQHWVKLLSDKAFTLLQLMDDWGRKYGLTIFERDGSGNLVRRRSRGHVYTQHCLIHALPAMESLRRKALEVGVKVHERTMITHLIPDEEGRVAGALGFNYRTGQLRTFRALTTVLAAGGCGFKSIFMGHRNLTGDLQTAAYRQGVIFRNMEQCQSNTCHKDFDIHGLNLFVNIGGKFLNRLGQEFMWGYNPRLGNRALLSELPLAFCQEVRAGRGPVYLDLTGASPSDQELCRDILPETFKTWDRAGVNPFFKKMEWVPAFYGTLAESGGLAIDTKCRTSIENLFAAGDMTYFPPFGAGIGGNALAFAAVSGYLAGEIAAQEKARFAGLCSQAQFAGRARECARELAAPLLRPKGIDPDTLIFQTQKLLFDYQVCYLKNKERLAAALENLLSLQARADALKAENLHQLVKAHEARNILVIAELFLRSSLFREESRGFHFREDFPAMDNKNWLKFVAVKNEGGVPKVWAEDVPTPYFRPTSEKERPRGVAVSGT